MRASPPLMRGAVADVSRAIGNTPIVKLNRVSAGLKADIYCKLEYLNPAGSMKDRIALNMIDEAERRGELEPGSTIVEATSGNTGMGLAMIAALRGYKCIFVMPDKQSIEKVKTLRAAGAKVIITPTDVEADDPRSYYSVSRRIAQETPKCFYSNQYHNQDNPQAHYKSTGPEIWEQTGGELDVFVAGLGTGGTITGTGAFLKERKPEVKLVGADVMGSVYTEFWRSGKIVEPHSYKVEGIGEDFFPSTINLGLIDHIEQLNDKECFDMTRRLARMEGLYTGGSGGAAVVAAIKYAERLDQKMNVLVLLPDQASKYLNKIFDDDWMREHGFLDPEQGLGTIRELLENKSPLVYTVQKSDSVRSVVELMKNRGISQVPVLDSGRLVGLVTESRLLQFMLEGGIDRLDSACGVVMSDQFEIADPDAPVGLFNHIFNQGKVIVVWERGEVRGLITKIDVIDHLAHTRRTT